MDNPLKLSKLSFALRIFKNSFVFNTKFSIENFTIQLLIPFKIFISTFRTNLIVWQFHRKRDHRLLNSTSFLMLFNSEICGYLINLSATFKRCYIQKRRDLSPLKAEVKWTFARVRVPSWSIPRPKRQPRIFWWTCWWRLSIYSTPARSARPNWASWTHRCRQARTRSL